jgi:pimeloyl-ACP methyl ester carboxylesterase
MTMESTDGAERGVVQHDGCKLSYSHRGSGFPVLLIQGVGIHGDGWAPQIEYLAARAAFLSFDNRGMSRSQPIGAPISVEQMGEDALVLMDAVGWSSAHIVGHSLGGLVALHLAHSARQRVRSLALLCTFARGRDAGSSPRMMWLGIRTRVGTRPMRQRAFLEIVLPPALLASVDRDALAHKLARLFGHDLADQPPVTMKQLGAMRAYDATTHLAALSGLPTLVVSAAHDPIAPPVLGRALAAGISGARYVELPDASHGVPIHDPAGINALLIEHLEKAESLVTT